MTYLYRLREGVGVLGNCHNLFAQRQGERLGAETVEEKFHDLFGPR